MPDDVAPPAAPTSRDPVLDRSLDLVRFLRANCPWDAEQTPTSLLRHLLEEAHETADAVASGDVDAIASELGDLLLNLAFQVVLAEERGAFTAEDVIHGLESKMRRRHPHLYGDGPAVDWAESKRRERDTAPGSLLEGLAGTDPLLRAQAVQERVAAVGFDWPSFEGAYEKVIEETAEVRELLDAGAGVDALEDEIGDLLFATVNLARLTRVHAGTALVRANAKFEGRFRALERLADARGVRLGEAGLEELDALWDEVKRAGAPLERDGSRPGSPK